MSDRYGVIVKTTKRPETILFRGQWVEVAHVKLDISGQTVRVILSDCEAV